MLLQTLLVLALTRIAACSQAAHSISTADFQLLSRLELCRYFRGWCGQNCNYTVTHRWNVPLCPLTSMECCTGPPTTTSPFVASPTPTPTPSTSPPPPSSHISGTCGFAQPPSDPTRRKRIVGGRLAARGRWPWLVGLRSVLGSHACSGVLIRPQWVVTAAHCFKYLSSPPLWRVRIGEYDLLRHDPGETDIAIESIIMNPGYVPKNNFYLSTSARNQNDIALIRLREPSGVEPICLPTNQGRIEHDEECWVAGWGVTRNQLDDHPRPRHVSGPVVSNQECSQMWNMSIPDIMMCFGDGTYGPCGGDSGSPLSCQNAQGQHTLEGVVSWGTQDCNRGGYPSVFTRVRSFLPWILQHVQDGDQE